MALRRFVGACALALWAVTGAASLIDIARADCVMPFRPSALLHGIREDGSAWDNHAVKTAVIATGSSPVLQPTSGWTDAIDTQQAVVGGILAGNGVMEGTSIGYSLGGLVGRDYMRASYPGSRIKVHMTVGTMHQGAPILDNLQGYRLPATLLLYLMADISLLAWGHLEPNGDVVRVVQSGAPYYSLAVTTALITLTELLFVKDAAGAASSNDMKPGSPLLHSLNDNQAYEADVTKVGIVAHENYPQIYRMGGSATGIGKDTIVGYTHQLEGYCLYQAGGWLWTLFLGQVDVNRGLFAIGVWMSGYATIHEFPKYWNNHLVGSSDNDGVVPASSQVYPGGYRADVYDTNHLEEQGSAQVAGIVTSYMNSYSHRYPPPPPPAAPTNLTKIACTNGVVLGWDPVATATSYKVYKDGAFAAEVTGTSYSTLAYETHTYAVQALACNAAGPLSANYTAGCPPPDPPPPGGVAALEWSRDWLTTPGWAPSSYLDSNGQMLMTFMDGSTPATLQMGTRLGDCTWSFETIDSDPTKRMGVNSALAIGPQHVAGVVYLKELGTNSYEVRYRRGPPCYGSHCWSAAKILGTSNTISTPSIAFDAAGTAHIAWYDGTGLKYATVTSGLVASTPVTVSTLAQAGRQSNSIAVDAAGNPSIAFAIDNGTPPYAVPALGFATKSGGSWTPVGSQALTSSGGFGARMVLNAAGEPRIACQSNTGRLMYVTWANATSAWSFATATNLYIESRLGIALDPSGLARMAVWSLENSRDVPTYVRECTTAPRWESSPFDTAGTQGIITWLGLGLKSDGQPIVGYSSLEGNTYSIEVANAVPGSPDVTPPAAATNVTVIMGKTTAVPTWTAPGDDGSTGTAAYYDVRYSHQSIVGESGFAAATPIPGAYCPSPAGYGDCVSVTGLSSCSPYYFALKVRDNAGNWSPVSASAYGVTGCSWGHEVMCDPGGLSLAPISKQEEPEEAAAPKELEFSMASPNPARGPARFQLAIPASSAGQPLRVGIYDAQGRRVRSILQEVATSGRSVVAWDLLAEDGSRARHGVYFARVQVGSRSVVRTVIVMD